MFSPVVPTEHSNYFADSLPPLSLPRHAKRARYVAEDTSKLHHRTRSGLHDLLTKSTSKANITVAAQSLSTTQTLVGLLSGVCDYTIYPTVQDFLRADVPQSTPSTCPWLCVFGATDEEIETIGRRLGLDALTIEDCQSFSVSPDKMEKFDKYLFVSLSAVGSGAATRACQVRRGRNEKKSSRRRERERGGREKEEDQVAAAGKLPEDDMTYTVKIIIMERVLITFVPSGLSVSLGLDPQSLRAPRAVSHMVQHVMECVISTYVAPVDRHSQETSVLAQMVLNFSDKNIGNIAEVPKRVRNTRRSLLILMRQLRPKTEFLYMCHKRFSSPAHTISRTIGFMSLHSLVNSMLSRLESCQETLFSSHQAYTSKLNIESTKYAETLNTLMFQVGVITAMVLPLNFFLSLFGMNVRVPGMVGWGHLKNDDGFVWFTGILITCVLVFAGSWAFFKFKRLI